MQSLSDSATVPHHIAGRRQELGPLAAVHNPANGARLREVHQAEGPQIVGAVESAQLAQADWARQPPAERARVLQRFAQLIGAQREELAALIVAEQGKTQAEALDELRRGLEFIEYACAAPELLGGRHSAQAAPDLDQWTLPQPLGVTVGVTPFNAPFLVPMWMAPLALACGNAFILKPSPLTPSTSVWLAETLLAAGLPPGVFQVLQGGPEVVQGLLVHPQVAALSFVGRSKAARQLYAQGGELGKRVQALGGAKNHAVVMPDADLDATASALIEAAYGMAGQRCMAISVLLLVGSAGDALIARLAERLRGLRVGPGHKPGVDMGPLISRAAKEQVETLIRSGELDGAKLVADGRGLQVAGHLNGYYLGPTLFDQVQPWMRIYQEEIFGPVLVALRVRNLDSALALVGEHPAAQGVALFTRDGGLARRFTQQVESGMVGINVALPQPMAWLGAGGWKGSQFGALQAYGPDGVRFYTRRKAVMERWT
jgi:malonate-semialdehyde dehydrogenase (acetylating)/methylmalonate-semialdehyde dehydrogenase